MDSDRSRYEALGARDRRFDGVFFVGVTSTGIYCRPICPAKTPAAARCLFFDSAERAEQAGFRPCLRCRPELAPGSAPVDDAERVARLVVSRLQEAHYDEQRGLEVIADQLELSSRQVRRIVKERLGVSPMQLVLTRRLLLAKQLLTETALSVTEVAFASGFQSVRRFNDAFRRSYGMSPSSLRRSRAEVAGQPAAPTSTLRLVYRPPYDWEGLLAFLRTRALTSVEHVGNDEYLRTVRIGDATGWIRVRRASGEHALSVEFPHELHPVLPTLLARVRALFDLDARPDLIARHLSQDPLLAPALAQNPGRRVPGCFQGFELGVRAILGQQVTVKAATTLARRFVEAFGESTVTPHAELSRLAPTAARLANVSEDQLGRLGVVGSRARAILALAAAQRTGSIDLDAAALTEPERFIERLVELPGIGRWTAHYIALRALRWPDAFPKEDIVLRQRLGGLGARAAEERSLAWRPWRAYAVLHLWALRDD